jgi:hypothetical protein
MGGRDGLQLWDQILKMEKDKRKHSKQLWECGVKKLHVICHRRGRMMKRAGDSKVGIHQIGDAVDTV